MQFSRHGLMPSPDKPARSGAPDVDGVAPAVERRRKNEHDAAHPIDDETVQAPEQAEAIVTPPEASASDPASAPGPAAVGGGESIEPLPGSNGKDETSTEKSVAAMATWLLGAALTAGSAAAVMSASGSDTKPQGDPKPDPEPKPGTESTPDPVPEPKPDPKPEPNPEPKPEPKPDPAVPTPATPQLTLHAPGASRDGLLGAAGEVRVAALEAGARWEYSLDGGKTWQAGSGTALIPAALGADGSKTLLVAQINDQGGRSAAGQLQFDMDTIAPVGPALSLVADTGASSTDGWSSSGTLRVDGLEADARWQYSVDGGVSWWNGTGTTIEAAQLGGDGAKEVQVRQTDAAGNEGPIGSLRVVLDTRAAEVTLTLANDTGLSSADGITRDATVKIGGLEPGLLWEYRLDGGPWVAGTGDTIAASEFGSQAGERRVELRHVDGAGNRGSAALVFTLDTRVAVPTASLAVDSGVADDGRTNDPTVIVGGLESGAIWNFQINGGEWQRGHGDRIDRSAFDGMADGAQTVRTQQIDAAGNEAFGSLVFQLQRQAAAPTVGLVDDSGLAGDGITRDGSLSVGAIERGGRWEFRVNGGEWKPGSGDRIAGSEFSSAPDGWQRAEVRHTDAVGNQATTVFEFQLDRVATAPTVTLADDTGVAGDRVTRDGTLIVGGLEAGGRWDYRIDGGAWQAGSGDRVASTAAGGEGAHRVEIRHTDLAGNVAISELAYVVDRSVASPTLALADDTGVAGDRVTRDATIAVGAIEAGAVWEYRIGGGTWKTGSGNRIAATEFAADGRHTVEVRQTDIAGNVSSASLDFTLDRQVGAVSIALVNDSGVVGDRITNDAAIAVSGVEAGNSWEYRIGNGAWKTGSGNRIAATEFGADGRQTVEVRQTDLAGNVSSASLDFTLDRQVGQIAATLVSDSGVDGDSITNDASITVSGIDAGGNWEYRIGSGSWKAGSGDRIAASEFVADGRHTVQVRQTDVAGNVSSASLDFTLDRQAAAVSAALVSDTGVDGDRITRDAAIAVGGLETGRAWEYRIGTGVWKTGSGNRIAATEFGTDGSYTVEVRQADIAGNVGTGSLSFTLDRVAAAPTASLVDDTGASATDGITSTAGVSIGGLEAGATWQFSRDQLAWRTGSGVEIPASEFSGDGAKVVWVRQVDAAGNTSSAQELRFTVDSKAATPALTLRSDQLDYYTDRPFLDTTPVAQFHKGALNQHGRIEVGLLETGATWYYSLDDGTSWELGSGTSFLANTLKEDGPKKLLVRQFDVAGNESARQSIAFDFDTTAPEVTVQIQADGTLTSTTGERLQFGLASFETSGALDVERGILDNFSGMRSIKESGSSRVDTGGAQVGSGVYWVYATDAAGNSAKVTLTDALGQKIGAVPIRVDASSKVSQSRYLEGTAGNDLLIATTSVDTMRGGAGADRFFWEAGAKGIDMVLDFRIQEGDVIDLSSYLPKLIASENDKFYRLTKQRTGVLTLLLDPSGKGSFGEANPDGLTIHVNVWDTDVLGHTTLVVKSAAQTFYV
ncbi:MAG: hypothetical protein J7598_17975 [Mitsuaria chitosanitabida]|uniref:Ig-like domain-containing protein n=1 Tax=Roseateles chitosanitabidus TaxID=65048 RepID=UPI001B25FDA2|nr:Ig-like domain-containing protein [Roseateles chitosanitabidus]MBO9688498.1 hypothetical protein [Roseateles chitosanitabidus]